MAEDPDIILAPISLLGKRKPETQITPLVSAKREKKPSIRHIYNDGVWSLFTDDDIEDMSDMAHPLLATGCKMAMRMIDTQFILHVFEMSGETTMDTIDKVLRRLNAKYKITQTQYDFVGGFVDIYFILIKPTDRRTGALSNVTRLEGASEPLPDVELVNKAFLSGTTTKRDVNDWLMISKLMTHAENVQGDKTPMAVTLEVETPDGCTVNCKGESKENKLPKRTNYLVRVTGYSVMQIAELRSFECVFPMHIHSTRVQWRRRSLQQAAAPSNPLSVACMPAAEPRHVSTLSYPDSGTVDGASLVFELEPYLRPRVGEGVRPKELWYDSASLF